MGAVLPTFQKIIVHQQPICQISKPARLPLTSHPTGAKDLNLLVLKNYPHLMANNLLIQYKIKGKV
jgi:hypothetical protein